MRFSAFHPRHEIQACRNATDPPITPRFRALSQRFCQLADKTRQGARCPRLCAAIPLVQRCLLGEEEKRKGEEKKKVNDSLLCSTSFIRLDYIEHHPVVRGRFPYTLSLFFFLYSSLPPSSFPRFFPLFFLPFFPAGQLLYTSLDACTHLHTAISLYRAYANVYAFQHARTRAYN